MVLETDVRHIVNTLKDKHSYEEIAQMLDCDVESVKSCVSGGDDVNIPKLKLRPLPMEENPRREVGRPKVFENRQLIEEMLFEHPNYTSIDVQRELLNQFGIEVSRRTLQRRISEIRANRLKQPKIAGISAAARQRRLEWAHAHKDWTVEDWRYIFNMDDMKVGVNGSTPKEIFMDTLVGPEGPECNDLNLLEQLMAIIEPKIKTQEPQNVYEFRSVLYDIWHSDPDLVNKINHIYETMTWRVAAVLSNGGAETHFI